MQNSTPPTMTARQFNTKVRTWATISRKQMITNAKTRGKGKGVLPRNFSKRVTTSYGVADKVKFTIPRYGVYLHYGVGRAHIRKGNSVIRDESTPKTYKYNGKEYPYTEAKIKIRKLRQKYYKKRNRSPLDWFDVVIRTGIKDLADISQEFYGDTAMNDVLANTSKYLIEKK